MLKIFVILCYTKLRLSMYSEYVFNNANVIWKWPMMIKETLFQVAAMSCLISMFNLLDGGCV